MAFRSTLVVLLAVLAAAASAKPVVIMSDASVRSTCPKWCFSKTPYGMRQLDARCPTKGRVPCTRESMSGDGKMISGYKCECTPPTTLPPFTTTTKPPTTATTLVTSATEPTVPPHAPGNVLFGTPTPQGPVACGTIVLSGSNATATYQVNIAKTAGVNAVAVLNYQFYEIPDAITVSYEGKVLYKSGPASGEMSKQLPVVGTSSVLDVTVNAPNPFSAWDFMISCA